MELTMKAVLGFTLYCLLASSYASPSSKLGINYGQQGNNLPTPREAIRLITSMGVGHVKLYDANPEVLSLLSGTPLQVAVTLTNKQISAVAANQSRADRWLQKNVLIHYPETRIRTILVGDKVFSSNSMKLWLDLVPAMENLRTSLRKNNIHNIKIGTPLAIDSLESSSPPSTGNFRSDIPFHVITSLMRFLHGTGSFFFLDANTYQTWAANTRNMSLDYALLQGKSKNSSFTDPATGFVYTNLLDQMIDSVYMAMQKVGFGGIKVVISETGWPHSGDIDQPGASNYNAATYIRNLVAKVTSNKPTGTPAKPGVEIPTYISSLFDENQKPGSGSERHLGMMDTDGRPIYEVDFTGTSPANNTFQESNPGNNVPYKGKIWCVAASDAGLMELDRALDTACGEGGGICDELTPGRACYEPVSVVAHASYAFSSYWAAHRSAGASCYFDGLAVETITDPSHGSCQFPSVVL